MPKCRICDQHLPPGVALCPACRAPIPTTSAALPADLERELLAMLDTGQKLEAVARCRDAIGLTLGEAKEVVEQLQRHRQPAPADLDKSLQEELLSLLRAGQKIKAVKLYKEHTGCGLADAKAAVEALAAEQGVIQQGSGCATVLLILAVISGLLQLGRLL